MNRPKLLDLFCCQGGASDGFRRAGFDVYGVDLFNEHNQGRYPFASHKGDAIAVLTLLLAGAAVPFTHKDGTVEWLTLADFAAIAASPPCQAFTNAQKIRGNEHPDLITPVRALLEELGKPYIIENVPGSPLLDPVELCGAMFGLGTYRHRLFESNIPLQVPAHPKHVARTAKMGRRPKPGEFMHVVGNFSGVAQAREVMDMPWASRDGLREAIPPAYTEFLGAQLLTYISNEAAA